MLETKSFGQENNEVIFKYLLEQKNRTDEQFATIHNKLNLELINLDTNRAYMSEESFLTQSMRLKANQEHKREFSFIQHQNLDYLIDVLNRNILFDGELNTPLYQEIRNDVGLQKNEKMPLVLELFTQPLNQTINALTEQKIQKPFQTVDKYREEWPAESYAKSYTVDNIEKLCYRTMRFLVVNITNQGRSIEILVKNKNHISYITKSMQYRSKKVRIYESVSNICNNLTPEAGEIGIIVEIEDANITHKPGLDIDIIVQLTVKADHTTTLFPLCSEICEFQVNEEYQYIIPKHFLYAEIEMYQQPTRFTLYENGDASFTDIIGQSGIYYFSNGDIMYGALRQPLQNEEFLSEFGTRLKCSIYRWACGFLQILHSDTQLVKALNTR